MQDQTDSHQPYIHDNNVRKDCQGNKDYDFSSVNIALIFTLTSLESLWLTFQKGSGVLFTNKLTL